MAVRGYQRRRFRRKVYGDGFAGSQSTTAHMVAAVPEEHRCPGATLGVLRQVYPSYALLPGIIRDYASLSFVGPATGPLLCND